MKKINLAILVLLGWVFSVILLCATWIMLPEFENLNLVLKIFVGIFSLGCLYVYKDGLRKLFSKELFAQIVRIPLVFFILLLLNYWANDWDTFFDFSTSNTFSLSVKGKNILRKLDRPINVKVFDRPVNFKNIEILLSVFKTNSKVKWNIEFIDIDFQIDLVKKYNIQKASSLVIQYPDKKNQLTLDTINESSITQGLETLSRSKNFQVAYLIEHGERKLQEQQFLVQLLKENLIDLVPVNISDFKKNYKDFNTVMIWGPTSNFFPGEIDEIFSVLNDHKIPLILGFDPQYSFDGYKNFNTHLMKFGLFWVNAVAIDDKNHVSGSKGTAPIVFKFGKAHPSTSSLTQAAFFPLSGFVRVIDSAKKDFEIQSLVQTNVFPDSYAKLSWEEILQQNYTFNEVHDLKGPLSLVVSSKSKKTKNLEVILFSNTSFLQDPFKPYLGNFQLMLEVLKYTTNPKVDIIKSEKKENPTIVLSGIYINYMFYFTTFIIPICLFMMSGFWIYYRKVA